MTNARQTSSVKRPSASVEIMDDLAKLLITFGIVITIVGGILWLGSRVVGLGRLPGDFVFTSGTLTCIVPLATSIILSIIVTIILNLILPLFRK
jgi:hypothetical protein